MSKIYQAYKKQLIGMPEITERLKRAGVPMLFPPPDETQREEFAKLGHRLLRMKSERRGAVIAVASSTSGEGASFVSYNLAQVLELVYEQRVAWIDGNYHSPQKQLHGFEDETFVTLLKDPTRVASLVSEPTRVTHIAGGDDLDEARAHFADKKYRDLIEFLAARFEFTLIDLPPVISTNDAALMAQSTDGLLLVVGFRQLKRERIVGAMRSLKESGVNLLGAVMNRRELDLPNFLDNRI